MYFSFLSDSEKSSEEKNVYFVSGSPRDVVKFIQSKGQKKALLIGGGTTNAGFLEAGLIDEIILSVHPMTLSQEIPLFKGNEVEQGFDLVDVRTCPESS